jgi:hypothetical protein
MVVCITIAVVVIAAVPVAGAVVQSVAATISASESFSPIAVTLAVTGPHGWTALLVGTSTTYTYDCW